MNSIDWELPVEDQVMVHPPPTVALGVSRFGYGEVLNRNAYAGLVTQAFGETPAANAVLHEQRALQFQQQVRALHFWPVLLSCQVL